MEVLTQGSSRSEGYEYYVLSDEYGFLTPLVSKTGVLYLFALTFRYLLPRNPLNTVAFLRFFFFLFLLILLFGRSAKKWVASNRHGRRGGALLRVTWALSRPRRNLRVAGHRRSAARKSVRRGESRIGRRWERPHWRRRRTDAVVRPSVRPPVCTKAGVSPSCATFLQSCTYDQIPLVLVFITQFLTLRQEPVSLSVSVILDLNP